MSLESLIERLEVLRGSMSDTMRDTLAENEELLITQQREQLFEGKSATGDDMRPYYTEDLKPEGYFSSVEKAMNYANWKASMSYPSAVSLRRDINAPNLYINGRFHSELGVEFGADAMEVVGLTMYAQDIMSKYGSDSFGWTAERLSRIMEAILPSFQQKIKDYING